MVKIVAMFNPIQELNKYIFYLVTIVFVDEKNYLPDKCPYQLDLDFHSFLHI